MSPWQFGQPQLFPPAYCLLTLLSPPCFKRYLHHLFSITFGEGYDHEHRQRGIRREWEKKGESISSWQQSCCDLATRRGNNVIVASSHAKCLIRRHTDDEEDDNDATMLSEEGRTQRAGCWVYLLSHLLVREWRYKCEFICYSRYLLGRACLGGHKSKSIRLHL